MIGRERGREVWTQREREREGRVGGGADGWMNGWRRERETKE